MGMVGRPSRATRLFEKSVAEYLGGEGMERGRC
jgi:hypothetical protein